MEFKVRSNFRGHLVQSPHFIHNLCYRGVFTIEVKYKHVQTCAKQIVRNTTAQSLQSPVHLQGVFTHRNELSIHQQAITILTQILNIK